MSDSVMLIAGPSGAKSTFAGGLVEHVEKARRYSISSNVTGDDDEFKDEVMDQMFKLGQYPNQTNNGYKVEYEIGGKLFSNPGTKVTIVDLPGGRQTSVLNPTDKIPLVKRIKKGDVADRESVAADYDKIKSDFKTGNPPTGEDAKDKWRTIFLYHYYNADKVMFLLNLYKIVEDTDEELVYDNEDIGYANKEFTDVAVVPAAVDWLDYDPESEGSGPIESVIRGIINPAQRDRDLLDHLQENINRGTDYKTKEILNHVEENTEVDFFSVSVPSQEDIGEAKTLKNDDDDDGNFVVKGFEDVIEWIQK